MTALPALIEAPTTANELLRDYPVLEMARTFKQSTDEIGRLMVAIEDQGRLLDAAFTAKPGEDSPGSGYQNFDMRFCYDGDHWLESKDLEKLRTMMKRRAWRLLSDRIGLRNIMSVKRRTEFEQQLDKGDLPDIDEETILDILMGLMGQAKEFASEAAQEVFELLRPQHSKYATNNVFRVGRRVILTYHVERAWDGKKFRPNYRNEKQLTAIDGIFHLLDGKGIMRENRGPLVNAINDSPDGRGETAYFRFKCFKNCNLHLEFKRLDLVQELNLLATGERVLGQDID